MREIPVGPSRPPGRGLPRFALLVGAVVLAALAGYGGYVAYPRFDLPASVGAGLLALAAGAGVASFFSPCAFPLLLTLLGREVRGRPAAAVGFAAAFSAGAVAFLLGLGALIAAGGAGIAASVTFTSGAGIAIRVVVGLGLVLLGLIQAEVLPVSFHAVERLTRPLSQAQARLRRDHPVAGVGLFGFAYLAIGFGWTGPILAGLAGQALAVGGTEAAVTAFAVAGVAIVLLASVSALTVALAQERLAADLETVGPTMKRWGGWVLVAVGTWFVALGVFADFFARVFPV